MPISLHTFPCLLKDSETFKNPSRLEILTWSLLSFGPLALSMCSGEQRGEVSLQLEQKCYTLEEKGLFKTLLSVSEEGRLGAGRDFLKARCVVLLVSPGETWPGVRVGTGDRWRASYSKSPLPHHCLATHFQHCATYPWASASSPLGLELSALCFPSPRFPAVSHYTTSHS